jgi:hypothetical protein
MEGISGFASQHLDLMLFLIAAVVFAVLAVNAVRRARKIEKDGIETDAVVSRIDENNDPDLQKSSYTIIVKYRDDKGEIIESPMALDPSARYEVGQKLRIKYIPGLHKQVRPVE